ncbi:RDD family protein [Nocardia sp. NPDC058658]|uniref:RDD family protein n=1 Tax=Nocardia sp. NPDC058658 TaxID=3346580 RepID=UPI0036683BA7
MTLLLGKSSSRIFGIDDHFAWFAGDPDKIGLIAQPGGARSRLAHRSGIHTPPQFGRAIAPSGSDPASPSELLQNSTPHESEPRHNGGHPSTRSPSTNPPAALFGGLDDVRFHSPRKLRRTLAYLLDVVAHVTIGLGTFFVSSPATQFAVTHREWTELQINWVAVIGYSLLASFIDRVVLQTITHTTIGKAVFGLVIIDRDTGRYPRMRWLLASWLVSGLLAIQLPFALMSLDGIGPERPERYMLPAVRRRDVRAGAPNGGSPPTATTTSPSGSESEQPNHVRHRDSVGDGIIGPST